jgi:hypothetical protein
MGKTATARKGKKDDEARLREHLAALPPDELARMLREAVSSKKQEKGERPPGRGRILEQALEAIAMLVTEARRPMDLAKAFKCSPQTVHRILNTINKIGLTLEVERARGGEVGSMTYYRLPREVLRAKLGI